MGPSLFPRSRPVTRILRNTVTVLCAVWGLAAHAQNDRPINVMCSAGTNLCEVLAKTYTRATGVPVNMVAKSTGEVLAQVIAERQNPKTDLWYGGTGDPHMIAAEQGLLEEYRSPQLGALHGWAQAQAQAAKHRTVGVYLGPLGFSYNPEVLKKKAQPVPACWADLLKPGYKGEVQMAHPNSSGTAYLAIATLVQIMGEDPAFDYLKKLHRNISQYPRSGSAPMRNAARGENAIGVSFIADVVGEAAASGLPIRWATPCEGTGYEVGSMSLIKGARNPEGAKRFYEWALTPAVQESVHKEAKSPQYASHSAVAAFQGMPRLNEIKFINYDFVKYGSSTVRSGLLARWEREVGSMKD